MWLMPWGGIRCFGFRKRELKLCEVSLDVGSFSCIWERGSCFYNVNLLIAVDGQ